MKNFIQVKEYDDNWPKTFDLESLVLREAVGANFIAVHHVGSTAVAGLLAKPKIDIILVVKSGHDAISKLEKVGYVYKGEWNIPCKFGFTKRGEYSVNLHVLEDGHAEIEANLIFRDALRNSKELRKQYQMLKTEILKFEDSHEKSKFGLPNYTLRKAEFIRNVFLKNGFVKPRILKCTNEYEWQKVRELSGKAEVEFDDDKSYVGLYMGAVMIGFAVVELESNRAIKIVDVVIEDKNCVSIFNNLLNKWLIKCQKDKAIKRPNNE